MDEIGDDEYSQGAKLPVISASQVKRQEEELEEIDQIMEDIIGSDDDEELEPINKEDQELSPSQPVLLSQKQSLLEDALKQNSQAKKAGLDDINDVLGDLSHVDGSIAIANNEEKISNSSSPVINEKLQRKAQKSKAKNKIELNVEMTEEMKRQEQSLNFGATPYSSKSISVANQMQAKDAQSGIGTGLNSIQKQKEFIQFKRQG